MANGVWLYTVVWPSGSGATTNVPRLSDVEVCTDEFDTGTKLMTFVPVMPFVPTAPEVLYTRFVVTGAPEAGRARVRDGIGPRRARVGQQGEEAQGRRQALRPGPLVDRRAHPFLLLLVAHALPGDPGSSGAGPPGAMGGRCVCRFACWDRIGGTDPASHAGPACDLGATNGGASRVSGDAPPPTPAADESAPSASGPGA